MRWTQPDGLARIPRDLCCGRPHLLEVAPPPELAPFAAFGWCHQPDGRAHHILADGEMDLMLLLEERTLLLSGPRDLAVQAGFAPPTTIVGLRLRLGLGARLLDIEPGELHNARVPLRELGSLGRRLAERVEEAGSAQEALAALLQVAAERARATPAPDPAATAAVCLIRASRGRASMRAVRQELGLGERQLERRFKAGVGLRAKTFARLVRFQAALDLARKEPGLEWGAVAAELDYADQAHLVHDARQFAGASPGQIRSPRSSPKGEADPAGGSARLPIRL